MPVWGKYYTVRYHCKCLEICSGWSFHQESKQRLQTRAPVHLHFESHMWNTSPQATSAPRRAWMAPEPAMYLIKAFFFFKLGSTCAQIPCTQKWSSISFLFSGHVSQIDFKLLMRLPTGMRSGFSKVILPIFVVL